MAADPLVTLLDYGLKILEIGSFVGGAGILLIRLGNMSGRFEEIGRQQASEIKELKDAVKSLIESGRRIDRVEERQMLSGKRVDQLEERVNLFLDARGRRIQSLE